MGADHRHHRPQVSIELAHMPFALAGGAAAPRQLGEALQIGEQHRHLQHPAAQHAPRRFRVGQDLRHHAGGHVTLEGLAQPAALPTLQQVGVAAMEQGQQHQAAGGGQQGNPAMVQLQRQHRRQQLQRQGCSHHPEPPDQGAARQGQTTGHQQGQHRQQGPAQVGFWPGQQAVALQGVGAGGGQQLQAGEGPEGGGVPPPLHWTDHHQGILQPGSQWLVAPALGIEHLPGG